MFGQLGAMQVLGLPAICIVLCLRFFLVPLIRRLAGGPTSHRKRSMPGSAATCRQTRSGDICAPRCARPGRPGSNAAARPGQFLMAPWLKPTATDSGRTGAALPAGSPCVILKLAFSGLSTFSLQIKCCRTHIEQIVSVHDLFWPAAQLAKSDLSRRLRLRDGPPAREKQMLTRKQFELLRFIHERLTEAGVPPPSTR